MLFAFLDIIEVEEVAVAVGEPVLLFHVLHRQVAAEAVPGHMAAGGDVLDVHAAQLLALGLTKDLRKIQRTVGERVFIFHLEVILEEKQQHGEGRRHQHRDERRHAELQHDHLQHHQRIAAEEHDKHPAEHVKDVRQRLCARADNVLLEMIHHKRKTSEILCRLL